MIGNTAETATSLLREEHRLILRVVDALSGMLAGDRLDHDLIGRCVTFFRLFVDACHHGEEEDLLFPALEAEGMLRDAGPIAMLLEEHARGRAHVHAMAAALPAAGNGDREATEELREAARDYVDLIEAHIGKEDDGLFDMADGMIVGPSCRDLCARYDEVCARRFDGQTKEDLERLAGEILELTD